MSEQLKAIAARVFDIPEDQVNDETKRGKPETWDSLNHLLLISEIEVEMHVQFTTDEVLSINSFKDLKEIVSGKKK